MNTPFVPMLIIVQQVSGLHQDLTHVDSSDPAAMSEAMQNVDLFRPNYGNN